MNKLNQRIYEITTKICPDYSKKAVPYYIEDVVLILDLKRLLKINVSEDQKNKLTCFKADLNHNDKKYSFSSFLSLENAILNLILSIPIKDLE